MSGDRPPNVVVDEALLAELRAAREALMDKFCEGPDRRLHRAMVALDRAHRRLAVPLVHVRGDVLDAGVEGLRVAAGASLREDEGRPVLPTPASRRLDGG